MTEPTWTPPASAATPPPVTPSPVTPPPVAPAPVTPPPVTPALVVSAPVVPAPATPPPGVGEDGLLWRRFHPVTPAIKGWKVLVVLLVVVGQQTADNVVAARDVASSVGPARIFLVLAGVLVLAMGYSAIAWRMTRYAVGPDAVYLRTGVLFRRARTARLDRIQAIDVVQPLLARLAGLAELKIEVAGGADSAVRLSFLREQGAHDLRAELLARAAGVAIHRAGAPAAAFPADAASGVPGAPGVAQVGPGAAPAWSGQVPGAPVGPTPGAGPQLGVLGAPAVPVAPEREVFAVTPQTLIGSLVRSWGVLISVLMLIAVVVAAIATRDAGFVFGMLPAVVGAGSFVWQRFAGEFNFRAALSPDGIRLRHGLLETRAQTVPPGRVQAVSIVQGPLWRGKDWWRVQMNVAGYGNVNGQSKETESVLLPVGTRADALLALWLVLPDLGVADPQAVLDAALSGTGTDCGFVTSTRRARWLDPLTWRRSGVAFTDRAVLVRNGWLVRRLVVVPHEKTQSLGVQQGPVQRGLGLASFALHSTPGPVVPSVPHLDAAVAYHLLAEQAERARTARARSGPERWMTAAGGDRA